MRPASWQPVAESKGNAMARTVSDQLFQRLREWGFTGSTAIRQAIKKQVERLKV